MSDNRKINMTGNGRRDFTVTHPQQINIKGHVTPGRGRNYLSLYVAGRYSVQFTLVNRETGAQVKTINSGERGRNNFNEKIQVSPGTYTAQITGADTGHRASSANVTIEYKIRQRQETNGDIENDYSGKPEISLANIQDSIRQPLENLNINPKYAVIGLIGLILLFILKG